MNLEKLFRVMVVGGALMTNAPLFAEGSEPQVVTPPPQEELAPLFCDASDADKCVPSACGGKKVAKEGFECCWGTSCDEQ